MSIIEKTQPPFLPRFESALFRRFDPSAFLAIPLFSENPIHRVARNRPVWQNLSLAEAYLNSVRGVRFSTASWSRILGFIPLHPFAVMTRSGILNADGHTGHMGNNH